MKPILILKIHNKNNNDEKNSNLLAMSWASNLFLLTSDWATEKVIAVSSV